MTRVVDRDLARSGLLFGLPKSVSRYAPGLAIACLITVFSYLLGRFVGGPIMLYAVVAGLASSRWIVGNEALAPGLKFASDGLLKVAIVLLGAKITLIDIAGLGLQTSALVIAGVTLTLSCGWAIGRAFGLTSDHAILSAGGVAICGCSAALVISAALPKTKNSDRNTAITVIGVTLLSTLAMVLYPLIAVMFSLNETEAGIFMGVTIHNVAQVVGAGYMLSDTAGETAVIVKLMRVVCLVPAVVVIGLMFRAKGEGQVHEKRPPLLPLFMVGFIGLVLANSLGVVPETVGLGASEISRWGMVIAIAAIGATTSFKQIVQVGWVPVGALIGQTAFLVVLALLALQLVVTL